MNPTQERDLLIAQTMAFAQSVIGKPADSGRRLEPLPVKAPAGPTPARLDSGPVQTYPKAQPIAPSLARYNDLREEIRGRVAAFRAHQELLRRERDEYCNSVLAKVQHLSRLGRVTPDDRPVKR
jgi:hypothetical protein